jgi:phytol kinase
MICPPVLHSDLAAFGATMGISLTALGAVLLGRKQGIFSSIVGRKLMHICTGPVFVMAWLLFPDDSGYAPLLASLVPGVITLYFLFVGLGWIHGKLLVSTVSRSGTRSEVLKVCPRLVIIVIGHRVD